MSGSTHRTYEVRCPVHGFVSLNDWERAIIDERPFQRLRRIRQLAWTDQVFPGASHSRFEHSLGVMHTATRLYDAVWSNSKSILESELGYKEAGTLRDRQIIRLAALLHDVGHGPFSHAAEDLMPFSKSGSQYRHEHYSASIVRHLLKDVIENHPLNNNFDIKADDVASLLEGSQAAKHRLFWRDLIDGQMDADRMDYLLRDSYHAGVRYGVFDLGRLITTVCVVPPADDIAPRLGIREGGWHSAESLVLARYLMFTQVYFHKTRVAYDIHLQGTLQGLLPDGVFPTPEVDSLEDYLAWDDWRVLGLLASGKGGEHGMRLAQRRHYRQVFSTLEIATRAEIAKLDAIRRELGSLISAEAPASKSWYKTGDPDIQVVREDSGGGVAPLSLYSNVVKNLSKNNQIRLYSKPEDSEIARTRVDGIVSKSREATNAKRDEL